MVKKYPMLWKDAQGNEHDVDFYVQIRARPKGGFCHRAIVHGNLPRLDDMDKDFDKYTRNTEKLQVSRKAYAHTVPGGALVMEKWPGRHVLSKLWEKLSKLSFLDMHQIWVLNPFNYSVEPAHEDIVDVEELFKRQ